MNIYITYAMSFLIGYLIGKTATILSLKKIMVDAFDTIINKHNQQQMNNNIPQHLLNEFENKIKMNNNVNGQQQNIVPPYVG